MSRYRAIPTILMEGTVHDSTSAVLLTIMLVTI